MRITLEFYVDIPPPIEDLDEMCELIREAVDEKIGQTDYMVQDVRGYNVQLELIDDQ